MSFSENLIKECENINLEISLEDANKFYKYMKLLLEWNEKINLTAITEENEVIIKHFIDSLTIYKYLNEAKSIIDVGTGAGFPGIPIKILNKEIDITLMDSLNKRINFLNEVVKNLNLERISCIHSRAEELGRDKKFREKYDVAVSRAVANMSTLVEYLLPFVKVGGMCICMKGSSIDEELKEAEKAIKMIGGKVEKVEKIILPNSDYERNIVIIRKINNTNSKFPRKAGIPKKEPIK